MEHKCVLNNVETNQTQQAHLSSSYNSEDEKFPLTEPPADTWYLSGMQRHFLLRAFILETPVF